MLETPSGPLFESNAICRFLAEDTPLYARSVAAPDIVRADIDKWVDWCQVRLYPACLERSPVVKRLRLSSSSGALLVALSLSMYA